MGNLNFDVIKQSIKKDYTASEGDYIVNGTYETDNEGVLKAHNGTVFGKDKQGNQGGYVCNFNLVEAKDASGKNQYSVSPLSADIAATIWTLIGDVDTAVMEDITPVNE